jgi:hypothetical protein
MFRTRGRYSLQAIERMRANLQEALGRGCPILLEEGIELYQLLDGRWQMVTPWPDPIPAGHPVTFGSYRLIDGRWQPVKAGDDMMPLSSAHIS